MSLLSLEAQHTWSCKRHEWQPAPKFCTAQHVCALMWQLCASCMVLSSTQVAASLLQKDALEVMAAASPAASHQPFLSGLSRIQSVDMLAEPADPPSLEETKRLSSLRVMDWIQNDAAATAVPPAADAAEPPPAAAALDQPLAPVADPPLFPIEDHPLAPDSERQGHLPESLPSHRRAHVTIHRERRAHAASGTHRNINASMVSHGDGC